MARKKKPVGGAGGIGKTGNENGSNVEHADLRQAEAQKLNVYRVDSHIKVERDGHEVARPGSHHSQLVAAESQEAAIAGAAKARGEGFEVAHVSNAYQDVLIVVPTEKQFVEK